MEFLVAKKHFYIHLVLMVNPVWSPFYSRATGTQRGKETGPRSHIWEVTESGFEPRAVAS